MYFYNHKINQDEQNLLLEMCGNACIYNGNGPGVFSITTSLIFY